jgi:DNA-binding transcriptional ArsR family regulator
MKKQSKPIRVLQIIDSLEAGGGERMAVNLANALEQRIEVSGLMVTRKEGLLKSELDPKVKYCFVNKQKSIDLKALKKAKQFIKHHQVIH